MGEAITFGFFAMVQGVLGFQLLAHHQEKLAMLSMFFCGADTIWCVFHISRALQER